MNKFKVGDLVRRSKFTANGWRELGHTVIEVDGPYVRVSDDPMGESQRRDADYFELIPNRSELEQLVAIVNAGYNARKDLCNKYGDKVSVHYDYPTIDEGQTYRKACTGFAGFIKEIRIIAEKKFQAYQIKVGRVSMEGDAIRVGCKTFNTNELRCALQRLCKENRPAVAMDLGSLGSLKATKLGVQHSSGSEVVSWADAEELMKRLEEYHK